MFFESVAFAMGQAGGAGAQGGGNPIAAFAPLIIMFAIFYFLLIRPQQKKAKEHRETLANLKRGDRIVTSGGVCGQIVNLTEETVTIDVGGDVRIPVKRAFISGLDQVEEVQKKDTRKDKAKKK
ncbi:preprotein translocase subunit YajC [Desulfoplanes formicivorans]|uniref:Sec translocon accessory complex subunit YajC n=1 Tax=Desulfoplanes formicivorans TaxID=1592317 RepID=A0A194AID2_9BACT|nr:preprotein translocase subunit YajC [Desulfoplanes formicivorans]GAU09842.1 preprotein translocase subunit YajC [Desulfoplanes formicivorans]